MAVEIVRVCIGCGAEFLGTKARCRACLKEYNAAWHAANKKRVAARVKKQRRANPQKYTAMQRRWYKANPDKVTARYSRNREKIIAATRKWQAKNPERVRARNVETYRNGDKQKLNAAHVAWTARNRDKVRAWREAWNAANPEKRRIQRLNYKRRKRGGKLSPDLIDRLHTQQRGLCACGCQRLLGKAFHLDHRIALARGGRHEDANMQLLTAACNMAKQDKDPIEFMQSRGFLL